MNSGYTAGWLQEALGIDLDCAEITCQAKGDEFCEFVLASPEKLESYVKTHIDKIKASQPQSNTTSVPCTMPKIRHLGCRMGRDVPKMVKSRGEDRSWFQRAVSKIVKDDTSSPTISRKKMEHSKKKMDKRDASITTPQLKQRAQDYFSKVVRTPEQGTLSIDDDNYVLMRASSFSEGFFLLIEKLARNKDAASIFSRKFLFLFAQTLGSSDKKHFVKKLKLGDHPLDQFSGFSAVMEEAGWGQVTVSPQSLSFDKNFWVIFEIQHSFESETWLKCTDEITHTKPVCTMCCGYATGWCNATFGRIMSVVEVNCKVLGDPVCRFILAEEANITNVVNTYCKDQKITRELEILSLQKLECPLSISTE